MNQWEKFAGTTLEMGDAKTAGKGIARIVNFLMQRISPLERSSAIERLKRKILLLDESQIAGKTNPPSSSMGQSITFIKNVLIGHDAKYIRDTLDNVVQYLH